jgi:hypothetical protein
MPMPAVAVHDVEPGIWASNREGVLYTTEKQSHNAHEAMRPAALRAMDRPSVLEHMFSPPNQGETWCGFQNAAVRVREHSVLFLYWYLGGLGGGQHFQSLPKSLPSHFHGRTNDAWGPIPPPDWRALEVTKQPGSDG